MGEATLGGKRRRCQGPRVPVDFVPAEARQCSCMPRARGVTAKQLVLLVVLLAGITCAAIWGRYLSVTQIPGFVTGLGRGGPGGFFLPQPIPPGFLRPVLPLYLAASGPCRPS